MPPKKTPPIPVRETMHVDWPLFGELSRALALKVSRDFDPDLVVGVATAGVVPGAVVAAMLDRPFHSIIVSRRYRAATVRDAPAVLSAAPAEVLGKRVLIVDETCNAGDTMRLARAAIINAGGATDFCARFLDAQDNPVKGLAINLQDIPKTGAR